MENIKVLMKKYSKHILVSLVVITLIISGIVVNANDTNNTNREYVSEYNNNYITVYISGEVNYPGKYTHSPFSRRDNGTRDLHKTRTVPAHLQALFPHRQTTPYPWNDNKCKIEWR